MKKYLCSVLGLMYFLLHSLTSSAQCTTPFSVTGEAVASEFCPGSGIIAVSTITPIPSGLLPNESYEYMLVRATDSSMVKSWQTLDTFSGGIAHGEYLILSRVKCATPNTFSDTVWTPIPIEVDSNLNYARILGVTVNEMSFGGCETGKITVNALGRAPLEYALVTGFQNAILLGNKQIENNFDSLGAGTHFVRVWDSCGGFDTYQFSVGSINTMPAFNNFNFTKYGCDSFVVDYQMSNIFNRPGTTDTAVVRAWIKWPNGETDTLSLPSGTNALTPDMQKSFGLEEFNNTYNPLLPFPQNIGSGIKAFTFGFRDVCGQVTEVVRNIQPSPLQIAYTFTDQGCDTLNYTFQIGYRTTGSSNIAFDTNGGVFMNSEAYYTVDSGDTWLPVTTNPGYTNSFSFVLLHRDSTAYFGVAYCLDTVFRRLDPRARDSLRETGVYNAFHTNVCQGAIVINPSLDALIGPGLTVEIVWSDPVMAFPPPVFIPNGLTDTILVPFGRYAVRVTDSTGVLCPRFYIDTIEVEQKPLNLSLGVYNVRSCINTAGITLDIPPGYGASNRNVSVEVVSQPSGSTIPATFTWTVETNITNETKHLRNNNVACVPPGTYTFLFTDSVGLSANCHRTDTLRVTVAQNRTFQNNIEIINECNGGLVVTRTGGPFYREGGAQVYPVPSTFKLELYNSSNVLIYTREGVNHPSNGLFVDFPISDTLVDALPNGVYAIRCYYTNIREIGLPYNTDSCTSTYINWEKGLPRIDPTASILVEGCDDIAAEAMIIGVAKGNYKAPLSWTLFINSVVPSNIVRGPQASNVFANLSANQNYILEAADACGVAQNYAISVTTILRLFATSNTSKACPGDDITFEVTDIPGSTYTWYKDNVIIPGADSHILVLENITAIGDSGAYRVEANLFNECTLSTSDFELSVGCESLPIHLGAFDAARKEDHIALHWYTLSEANNKGFYIERSSDAISWKSLSFQSSKGNSGQSKQELKYEYRDYRPMQGANFYRIKQVDFEGNIDYSAVKLIQWTDNLAKPIVIYPNPATDEINIKGLVGNETIRVYDVMGRMLLQIIAQGKAEIKLSLGQYIDGAYNIYIQNEKDVQFHPFLKHSTK